MKNYKPKKVKLSDKYWKINLMKILEVFEFENLCWMKEYWHQYGISNSDAKKIEQAYEVYQRQKEENKKKDQYYLGEETKKTLENYNK